MASQPKTPPEKSISQQNKNVVKANPGAILAFRNTSLDLVKPLEELAGVRGSLKRIWLREHHQEVVDFYTSNGKVATMVRYHISAEYTLENLIALNSLLKEEEEKPDTIWGQLPGEPNNGKGGGRKVAKGSPVPPGWYVFKRGTVYDYIKPANEVAELRGGEKAMWLRIHHEDVEDYFYQHGEAATLSRFCLKGETLDAVLKGGRGMPFVNKFTKVEKLELSMDAYRCDTQDLRKEVKDMHQEFGQFQATVADKLLNRLINPLLQNAMTESEAGGDVIIEHRCPPHFWKIGADNIGRCVYCSATKDFSDLPEKASKQLAKATLRRG